MEIRVKEMREKRGFTITELSKKTGVSYNYIYNLENGLQKGSNFEILESICKALKCSVSRILVIEK